MLEVRDLHVNYGPIQALRGVDVDVQQGEIIERGTHEELMKIKKGAYAVLAQGISA